jgi:mRNA interferase HigB
VKVVGFDIVVALIARERKQRPQQAPALDHRMAAWRREVQQAQWKKPTEVKAAYGSADIIGDNRIVFDICGNHYRLIVKFNYVAQVARIRFAGTHGEYDQIDASKV